MKSAVKKILLCIFVLLSAIVLFLIIRLFTLPRLDPSYVYHDHEYDFISDKYGTTRDHLHEAKEKAVARFYDAIIYTLKDDPDEFYLSPRVFLAHLPYNLLGRSDMMQPPTGENVDHIDIGILNGEETVWNTLSLSAQNVIMEAYEKGNIDPEEYELKNMYPIIEKWEAKADCDLYDIRIWFKKPNDLYYKLMVVKSGSEYGLLLEDGETLIEFDGGLLP